MTILSEQSLSSLDAVDFAIDFSADNAEIFRRVDIGHSSIVTRLDGQYLGEVIDERDDLRGLWDAERLRGAAVVFVEGDRLPESLRFVDLFAGCGGLSYGVQEAAKAVGLDSEAVLAVDNDTYALEIFRNNLKANRVEVLDLSENEASVGHDVDLLIGGPPCQGHSNLNNHTRRLDERDDLYLQMPKFAADHDIPLVAIENVPAIVSSYKSIVERAKSMFDENGYDVSELVMDASQLGVPQTRKRHFMFASRIATPEVSAIYHELMTSPRVLGWAIDDLREKTEAFVDRAAQLSAENQHRINEMFNNDWYELPNHLRPPSHQNGHSYGSVYGRMHWDKPASTLTTRFATPGCGRFIHPLERRTLTIHEGARIQGFPDDFQFVVAGQRPIRQRLTRAIGNAVPPAMGFVVGIWAISALVASGEM